MKNWPENTRAKIGILTLLLAVALISFGIFLFLFNQKQQKTVVGSFFINAKENLKSTNNRTNLILLGIGGEGHKGADLTDSMIFASINYSNYSVTLLPIPRDIWVNTLKAKVNTAYHYGEEKREAGGIDLAKSAVSEITGQPIHYAVVLDFEGFIRAVDSIGGITVNVERAFDDYKYPIPGKENAEPEPERYQHIHFDKGTQHMNGERTLKFARSRHAEGEEGTDFARSARQQKIISAFLKKVFSTETLLDPKRLTSLRQDLSDSLQTDIQKQQYSSFLKIALEYKKRHNSLSTGSLEPYFHTPDSKTPYNNQWVLVPKKDWQQVHDYVQDLVEK